MQERVKACYTPKPKEVVSLISLRKQPTLILECMFSKICHKNANMALAIVSEFAFIVDYFQIFMSLVVLLLLGYYLQWTHRPPNTTHYTLKDIPGPTSWVPVFGVMLQLTSIYEALKTVSRWNQKYNKFFKINVMFQTIVVFHQPELIRQLLSSTDLDHSEKSPFVYGMLKPYISNSVLVSSGEFWQKQRRVVNNTKKLPVIRSSMSLLNRRSKHLVVVLENLFKNGGQHTIGKHIFQTFLQIITEMITGTEIKLNFEFQQHQDNYETWKSSMIKRQVQPYLQLPLLWIFHPTRKASLRAANEMNTYARQLLEEHKARRLHIANYGLTIESSNADNHEDSGRSILQDFIDAGMPDEQIIDEVNTILTAGHETSATIIHFFCLKLAQCLDYQMKCHNEVDRFFETLGHDEPSYNDVNSGLKYLEQCLLETMRMFPPIVCYLRQLKAPLQVELENKTYVIPSKTNIVVGPIIVHRDPTLWPHPEKFDPDRFLPEEMEHRHKFAFVPFSAGIRSCPGQKFAMLEMKTVAAFLLKNFRFEVESGAEEIKIIPATTLSPEREYLFTLTKRRP